MNNIVEPKSLAGTMELLPKEQILFNEIKNKIEKAYRAYGFMPIDTPIIESANVLLAKAGGETEKQIYKFKKGDNDICLRFDLTVPLAKYVAANLNDLAFPFKRYQIGKVYRGEKAQKGRYREFYQCDIDTIGKETLSHKNDAEYPAVIYSIFKDLNLGDFVIYLNNRKIVNGFLEELELISLKEDIMRILDKFYKIGADNVKKTLLEDYSISQNKVNKIMEFVAISGNTDTQINMLQNFGIKNQNFIDGVNELAEVVKYIRLQGVPDNNFAINLSIVRGLDYYTGTVFETFLTNYPSLGSVCSGGRYDNLAGFYTKQKLPGVGISIGLTRLFYQLCENQIIQAQKQSVSDILILPMDDGAVAKAYELAGKLRLNGINAQIYVEDTKFKNKMTYADKLSVPYIAILGEDEVANNYVTIKDMQNRTQQQVSFEQIEQITNMILEKTQQ